MPDSSLKMDCLLGCFGVSPKRKRRKQTSRVLPGGLPPASASLTYPSINLHISSEELSVKSEEIKEQKIEKRVRFNLEVQAYDPVKESEVNAEENEKKLESSTEEKRISEESKPLFPLNHRYGNCDESYYEDEFESELEYEDEDDIDEEEEIDRVDNEGDAVNENVDKGVGVYAHSVLKPIENMAQWKAAISGKESKNISNEISVAASLSSWLVSSSGN